MIRISATTFQSSVITFPAARQHLLGVELEEAVLLTAHLADVHLVEPGIGKGPVPLMCAAASGPHGALISSEISSASWLKCRGSRRRLDKFAQDLIGARHSTRCMVSQASTTSDTRRAPSSPAPFTGVPPAARVPVQPARSASICARMFNHRVSRPRTGAALSRKPDMNTGSGESGTHHSRAVSTVSCVP